MTMLRSMTQTTLIASALLAVACGGTDDDTGTETPTPSEASWSSITGAESQTLYEDMDVDTILYQCEAVYDIAGAPYSETCEGCDFAFDADYTFNASSSDVSGCTPVLGEDFFGDYEFVGGFMPAEGMPEGYNGYFMALYDEWAPIGYGNFTGDTTNGGGFDWNILYYSNSSEGGHDYYYYNYALGSATLQ